MLADRLKKLADEAVGRPVGKADLAATLAYSEQLGRGAVLVGREHYAEGGHDHVEPGVRKGQSFGVGLSELDREPFGLGTLPGAFEECRHIIAGDHVAPAAGGG